ncbi:MAG TPA: hypothetical protein VFS43_10880 [Polyangiaceae bacterium]|nr:hypothetical protein [Polyangiaceae bacterium]
MRARIYDPVGPWWWRLPLPLLGALCLGGGLAWGQGGGRAIAWPVVVAGLGLLALSRVLPTRFAERDARLELAPGRVEVREAGPLTQRIDATRVRAASTAQLEGEYAVALEGPGRGRHPLVLKVRAAREVERLCDALGVGYYGVGELRWAGDSNARRLERSVAWAGAAGGAFVAACLVSPGLLEASAPFFALAVSWVATAALVLAGLALERLRRGGPSRWVGLTKAGLDLSQMGLAFRFVPYHLIEAVTEAEGAVEVTLVRPYGALRIPLPLPSPLDGGSAADVAALAAQLRTAARRARGDRAPEPGVGPSVEALRRHGESVKAWLERLDATAQAMRAGSIYRGAAVSARELCEALDNHDADPELRAAAARVLLRVDPGEARPRVDAALATLRDADARRRLRLVADEADEADGEALEALEALEARRAKAEAAARRAR